MARPPCNKSQEDSDAAAAQPPRHYAQLCQLSLIEFVPVSDTTGLTFANIESELSYAYLHAIAANAGVACAVTGRHLDNVAVDAMLTGWGPFQGGGPLTEGAY